MRTVRVNKGELIEKLTANRRSHKAEFDEAIKGYREHCITTLNGMLVALGRDETPDLCIHEPKPEDHTKDYDLALAMLNMSVDNVIELTSEQFNQFINDDWEWRARWAAMNTKYLGK